MSSKVSLSRNGAWSWRQSVTSNKVNLKTQQTHSSVCASMRTHAHIHASPLLASAGIRTLSKDANRALDGHLVWTWILQGKTTGDILVEDLGKSWRFSGRQLAHFVEKGNDVLGPRWHVPWRASSSPGSRKTWHASLQCQFYSMTRDLTHCVYFKTNKNKLCSRMRRLSKIEHKTSKQFHTQRVFLDHAPWSPTCKIVWFKNKQTNKKTYTRWSLGFFLILKNLKLNTRPALRDSNGRCVYFMVSEYTTLK